jgi:hypothetical protein
VVLLAAAAIAGILFGIVFPNLAFGPRAPMVLSVVAGITLALTWSSLAVRRPRADLESASGLDLFIAPIVPPPADGARGARNRAVGQALAVIAVPLVAFVALGSVERSDWNFLIQKLIIILEWVLTFGFLIGLCRAVVAPKPTNAPTIGTLAPAALAVAVLFGTAQVSQYVPRWTSSARTSGCQPRSVRWARSIVQAVLRRAGRPSGS